MPFWKGEQVGRPLELGRAVGAFVREMSGLPTTEARDGAGGAGLDEWAADNLLAYLREQREATRHVPERPDDPGRAVPRRAGRLAAGRALPVRRRRSTGRGRSRSRRGCASGAAWSATRRAADDGIVLRLPDALDDYGRRGRCPRAEDVLLDPDEVEQVVVAELGGSALFAARFRECAARALLLPRRDPRRRTPLWQQRQRASQLLAVAGRYEQFPVTLEAMRECVQDVYDLPGLRALMADVQGRAVRVVEVATPSPSPFARSLLFGYVGMFLYEADAPLAERRAAALSLDSTLLAELLGSEAIRELLDAEVLAEVEASLQRLAPDRHARDVEGAADLLRFLGDLTVGGGGGARGARRSGWPSWSGHGGRSGCASAARSASCRSRTPVGCATRWAPRCRSACPRRSPSRCNDPLGDLLLRYARTHGPFPAAAAAARFGLGVAVVTGVLDRLVGIGRLVRGELRPAGEGVDYCDAEVLRRLRRASLARLRAEVEPVEPRALGRFLPAWQGVQTAPAGDRRGRMRRAPGAEDVLGVVEQLAGAPLPASAVESLILPARLPGLHAGAARRAHRGGRGQLDRLRPAGRIGRLARAGPGRRRRPAAARAGARHGRHCRCTRPCWRRSTAAEPCSSASSPMRRAGR